MLAEQRCRTAVGAGGFGQLDRGGCQRKGGRQCRMRHLFEQMRRADMGVVERLPRRIELAGDDARTSSSAARAFGAVALGAPQGHPRGDDLAMVGARLDRRQSAGRRKASAPRRSSASSAGTSPRRSPWSRRSSRPGAAVEIGRRRIGSRGLTVATRSMPVKACSIRAALAKAIAVRSRAPRLSGRAQSCRVRSTPPTCRRPTGRPCRNRPRAV